MHFDDLFKCSVGSAIPLPKPRMKGKVSLEAAIAARRSVRTFSSDPIDLQELSQLLWAAQGITHEAGLRTAPSAGACYPIELYAVTDAGVFHYQPVGHQLCKVAEEDIRGALGKDPLGPQPFITQAPVIFVFAVAEVRTFSRYGPRGKRYINIDVGHAAENLFLQAVALGLGSCAIGAFDDAYMNRTLALPPGQEVMYLVPVGKEELQG